MLATPTKVLTRFAVLSYAYTCAYAHVFAKSESAIAHILIRIRTEFIRLLLNAHRHYFIFRSRFASACFTDTVPQPFLIHVFSKGAASQDHVPTRTHDIGGSPGVLRGRPHAYTRYRREPRGSTRGDERFNEGEQELPHVRSMNVIGSQLPRWRSDFQGGSQESCLGRVDASEQRCIYTTLCDGHTISGVHELCESDCGLVTREGGN